MASTRKIKGKKIRQRKAGRSAKKDTRTIQELFAVTLAGEYYDDPPWIAISELQRRGTREVLEIATKLCKSGRALERARGVAILGQFARTKAPTGRGPHFEERLENIMRGSSDPDQFVVRASASALSLIKDEDPNNRQITSTIIKLSKSKDWNVRWSAAIGLWDNSSPAAINTLLKLMQDKNDCVRDWATAAFGVDPSVDSKRIREALRARLSDKDEDVRKEAVCGLALRKDPDGLRPLLQKLETDIGAYDYEFVAARTAGLPYDETPRKELCEIIRKWLGLKVSKRPANKTKIKTKAKTTKRG